MFGTRTAFLFFGGFSVRKDGCDWLFGVCHQGASALGNGVFGGSGYRGPGGVLVSGEVA
jgi:hypothetical protein